MNASSLKRMGGILAVIPVLFVVTTAGIGADAEAANPASYGMKKANKAQKRALKRVAAKRVKQQHGWYVSKSGSPRWAIVCGKEKTGIGGASYRKTRGRWVLKMPIGSGGMQTITGLCWRN